jgi:hypothetical protein
VDTSLLEDWTDTERYPGKQYKKTKAGQAVISAQGGQMRISDVLGALQFIDQQWQNSSFVTNFVTGLPGYRSNITLGETQIKTEQSRGVFDAMAKNLEGGAVDCVELAFDFLHQYVSRWKDPILSDIVGPENARMLEEASVADRMRLLGGNFQFTVSSISASLQKAEYLKKVLQAAQIAGAGPYAGYIPPGEVLSAIVDTLDLGDRLTVAEKPMIPMEQAQQIVAEASQRKPGEPPKVSVSLRGELDPMASLDLADGAMDGRIGAGAQEPTITPPEMPLPELGPVPAGNGAGP